MIFVTGATGFVGRHIVDELRRAGLPVRALVRAGRTPPAGTLPVRGDLDDVEAFSEALRGCRALIHAAALLDPVDDPVAGERINRVATRELARAAARQGVRCFVFVSSIAAVGIRHLPGGVRPDTPCRPDPRSVYARTKRAAELDLLSLGEPGLRLAIVRPPTVYGPGEHGNFLALTRAIDSGWFLVPGDGGNRVPFCHARNLAGALRFIVDDERCSGVLHVSDHPPLALREVVASIARHLRRAPPHLPFPLPLARLAAVLCEAAFLPLGRPPPFSRGRLRTLSSDFALDCSALRALGWEPTAELTSALPECIAWYRDQGLLRRR